MQRFIFLLMLVLTACQATPSTINFHESVEQMSDVSKLLAVMDSQDIHTSVLHGIPDDLLQYKEGQSMDLSEVEENNALLAEAAKENKGLKWVCAVDPGSTSWEAVLDACLEQGAIGVKAYLGYSYTHQQPIDAPSLNAFYSRLEEEGLFLMMPVHLSLYGKELENVLKLHPGLTLIVPHYALSLGDLVSLRAVLDAHTNLMLDTSFGHIDYVSPGFELLTQRHDEVRQFMLDYQDRLVFATNNVMTTYEDKEAAWFEALYSDYLSFFTEQAEFTSKLNPEVQYKALDLPASVQNKILFQNAKALLQ